ncbi:MAG: tetratricopeptide repeat protein [Ignavibacteriales bacterium]|nr:tetratricopeptide repeat protein [Ignavibacteriales bacterium]
MSKSILSLIIFFLFSLCTSAQKDGDDVVIGKYYIINSKILGEERHILVRLPVGYEDTNLNYPVVYHSYGDYVLTYFADAASIIERLYNANRIPQVILIGIDNTDRYRDLRPMKPDGSPGGIENFIRYFTEELIPFVKNNFRTADYNILIGPQAGNCFGLYTLMKHINLFDAFMLDNSFQNPTVISEYLLTEAKSFFNSNKSLNKFLFMKVNKESPNFQVALQQKEIIETNLPENFRFEFRLTEPEDDFLMSTDIQYGLKELFYEYKIPKDISIKNLDDVKRYYQTFSDKFGFQVNISDITLREVGEKLANEGNDKEAGRIYEYILTQYPKSLDGLFRVAELNVKRGKYEEAKKYYEEFLKIRPNEAIIQNKLKNLEKFITESAAHEIERTILIDGLDNGLKKYKQLRNDNLKYFNENEFIQIGYRFLKTDKTSEAIEIFKISVELFPESFNVWDSLGEAYMKNGDTKNAIINYEKSLELNPKNNKARKMLEQLQKN